MSSIKPLYIKIGSPVYGKKNFFRRDKIINRIWRKLERGENLLLVAPRRVGKSSILKNIERNPKDGYIVKYNITMGVHSSNEFFKKIYDSLLEATEESGFLGHLKSYYEQVGLMGKSVFRLFGGIKVSEAELEFNQLNETDYYVEVCELLDFLSTRSKVILLFDEFPDTVFNISRRDREEAIAFLQNSRDLRQNYPNVKFVLTGSIGLENVIKRLNKLDLINDLEHISLSQLSNKEAISFIDSLSLGLEDDKIFLNLDSEIKQYIVKKISWVVPIYIQIVIDKLSNYTKQPIEIDDIDAVFQEIIKERYFEYWRERLKETFDTDEQLLATKILSTISKNSKMSYNEMKSIANPKINLKDLLEVLKYDGYLN